MSYRHGSGDNERRGVKHGLGHPVGDRLIRVVAQRLQASVREEDTVARLGGDEFTVILEGIRDSAAASSVARKIIEALSHPISLDGPGAVHRDQHRYQPVPYRRRRRGSTDQTRRYRDVPHQGQGPRELFFTEELNKKALRQFTVETRLRRALERDELRVFYQPQVDLASGRIISAEALVRWLSPGAVSISPAEFIPIAEESGLIVPIGEWVMRTACRQVKAWHEAGFPELRVAVNLSARQLRQPNLLLAIKQVLRDSMLPAHCLELELTESMLLQDAEAVLRMLSKWQELGIYLSTDDFGTGYSSLSYLKRLPVHHLKVAQDFVRDIPADPNDAAIAKAIVSLAKSLGLRVIAEGVETQEQLAFFQALACDIVQGYLFSRPLPADEFERLLKRGTSVLPIPDRDRATLSPRSAHSL
jgi:EAL domain-containing protein (putative c-di-GMP-specific phosphodiesterase class I)